jgi:predicted phosphoribosyltransferase
MVAVVMGPMFRDRSEAGTRLAATLVDLGEAGRAELVLGIPRGGVVVAEPVARALGCPLDVVLARKLGAPLNPELAIGAVGPDGRAYVDEMMALRAGADRRWIEHAIDAAAGEVRSRLERFRGDRPPLDPSGRRVIVVDDGVATGSTALAVGHWLVDAGISAAVLAVPVAPTSAPARLAPPYERLVALALPQEFLAVGTHYRRFEQTTDAEVQAILAATA